MLPTHFLLYVQIVLKLPHLCQCVHFQSEIVQDQEDFHCVPLLCLCQVACIGVTWLRYDQWCVTIWQRSPDQYL